MGQHQVKCYIGFILSQYHPKYYHCIFGNSNDRGPERADLTADQGCDTEADNTNDRETTLDIRPRVGHLGGEHEDIPEEQQLFGVLGRKVVNRF